MKRLITLFAALCASVVMFAQDPTGGITGKVVNRQGRTPVEGAQVTVLKASVALDAVESASDGSFLFEGLEDGSYQLRVNAEGFLQQDIFVKVEKGFVRDIMFVTMTAVTTLDTTLDDSSFAEQDLLDTGYSDSPTILFDANDPFTNVVGYGFSSIRYKNRGYNSETQQVYLAGVPMNDALTGYSPYSLWSGLNEAMRSKDTSNGLAGMDVAPGSFNGVTNIHAVPSSVRPGWRFSILSNSAMYRLRLMANYASGVLDNGWSYAVNVSSRLGGNDWVKGVYYKTLSVYAGAEKSFDDYDKLALAVFAAPTERGSQNASTQEVYDLMGDNMYNSNWGYQNGKVRNSRVKRSFEPVFLAKYDLTPSEDFALSASLIFRTGRNGSTALDWYDAADPRPDYYRSLPSYAFMEDSDYNRQNEAKAAWATFCWTERGEEFNKYQHLDWDRLYNVNYMAGGRSKYAVEERHIDQNDLNLAINAKWNMSNNITLRGGFNGKINRTEYYKVIDDLLGGEYFLNVDSFAERDFAANQGKLQNDLDYYLEHGEAEKITEGGKYGYDYLAQVRKANAWTSATARFGALTLNAALSAGVESFWREGLVRKGLFAGLDDNGREIVDPASGKVLTSYDSKGNVITSKGKSAVSTFGTGSAKLSASYDIPGGHRFSASAGYFLDAPKFSQSFISARTRNSLLDGLTNVKTLSTEASYQYFNNGVNIKLTGYYTAINDLSKVMSFYDDSQNSFTNFAMTGINQRHAGIELGAKIPLPVSGLSLSAVAAIGEHIYVGTPHMVQTVDNSSQIVREGDVPYWSSHPVYEVVGTTEDGTPIYNQDVDGNFVETGRVKHYVPSSPQLATELALNYNVNYWFFEVNAQYFDRSYLDMNPLYRTDFACAGGDGIVTPAEVEYMASQEKFAPAFLLNCSIGKSWYIRRQYQIGFSFEAKNLLNNTGVRTGGYEATRLISSYGKDRYYRFDSKYFYMPGANYMLNIYFRF